MMLVDSLHLHKEQAYLWSLGVIWYDFVSNRKLACWVKTLRLGQRWHPSAFRVASQHQELAYFITSAGIYVASQCYPIWRNGGDSVGISLHIKASNFQHVWLYFAETTHLEKAIRALKGHVMLAIFWLWWLQLWENRGTHFGRVRWAMRARTSSAMRGVLVVSVLALCKVWCDRAFAAEVCETATGRGCEGVNDGAAILFWVRANKHCVIQKKEGERNDQERTLVPLCSEKTILVCGNLQPRATTSLFVGGLCWESLQTAGNFNLIDYHGIMHFSYCTVYSIYIFLLITVYYEWLYDIITAA